MKTPIVVLFLLLILNGCSSKENTNTSFRGRTAAPQEQGQGRNRYLAYEHSVSIDTDENGIKGLYEKLVSACNSYKANECTVLDSNLTTGRNMAAQIKIRTKPEGVKSLIEIATSNGEMTSQATHVEDLARAIIDSDKRVEMLKQYQKRLMELERRANRDVDSLIKVSKELATIQSELEQASGENVYLLQRVNMDILNISISTRINQSFWAPIRTSISDFSSNLSNSISSAFIGIAYILPWIVLILILVLIGRKVRHKMKS